MLSALRAFSQTWPAKLLFAVLIVSFGAFGISNVIFDLGSNTLARVGDQEITVRDYQRAYQGQINQIAQQMGQMPTNEQATAMGVPGMVLSQLAADAAINQMALNMGIGVSDARLAKRLREDPNFAGTLGTFDPDNFKVALQQSGYTEADYFDLQARGARREQLATGLFADAAVPKAAIELVNRYVGDTRTIDYFVLNSTTIPAVAEPTEDDLKAYLAAHQADYRTKEMRTADVLLLSPETLAANETVTEDEISAEYERTKQSLTKPEKRTIVQVALPNDTVKAAFEAGKAAGKSLEDLAKENNLTVTPVGDLARSEVADAALGDAAFGLKPGEFTIIPGAAGPRAVGVTAIEPGGTPTLAELHDKIAQDLKVAKAKTEILDVLDQIEELRAAFKPLNEIAERFKLPVVEVQLSGQGAAFDKMPQLNSEEVTKISNAIFAAEEGKLASTVPLSSSRNVWFDLKSVKPARDQTLDEVRDQVAAAWTAEQVHAAEEAEAKKITAVIQGGTTFEDAAASLNVLPSVSPPITRSGSGTPVIDQTVAAAAFDGGPGHIGYARNGDGDYVVFRVEDVTPPAEQNPQAVAFVQNGTRDSMFADFVSSLRADFGVHENAAAINQVLALNGP